MAAVSRLRIRRLILCTITVALVGIPLFAHANSPVSKPIPALIAQGPYSASTFAPGDQYWFQTGAMGYGSSWNYVAASVTIQTVHDGVNNDAHSYWVGGFISNGAFVQVGYLNEVSTTGQPYCCAWFYEYFLGPNSVCCNPVIGAEGSAGPIGSWHNYPLAHTGNGVWSFYMDGRPLGSTSPLGATSSGSWPPGAIGEVAAATTTTDTLGPAEFTRLSFRTARSTWQRVSSAGSFLYYGKGTSTPYPPNPYWVAEVEGVDNDFLIGSYIPQPPNTIASQSVGAQLWPTTLSPNRISFQFVDFDNSPFEPTWMSLRDSTGNRHYYTLYANQSIPSDSWTMDRVFWHSIDVATPESFSTPGTSTLTLHENVFSVRCQLIGTISGLPVSGATATTTLPDGLATSAKTDSHGIANISQLPPSQYNFVFHTPYGLSASVRQNVTGPTVLTHRVFGIVEIGIVILLPIGVATLVAIIGVRHAKTRQVSSQSSLSQPLLAVYCPSCGSALDHAALFCPNCGAAVDSESILPESKSEP